MIHRSACSVLLLMMSAALMGQSRDNAYLKVISNTSRGGVFVDGKYVGPAANLRVWQKYAVTPGIHEIRLSEPRFEDAVWTLDCPAGKTTKLKLFLGALPKPQGPFGILRVANKDKFAAVYVNDKFHGHAGEFNNVAQGIQLAPGEYLVRVEPRSGDPIILSTAQIVAGKAVIVK